MVLSSRWEILTVFRGKHLIALRKSPVSFNFAHGGARSLCVTCILLVVFLATVHEAAASDQATSTPPKLSCVDKEPCSIPVVDPTTVYRNLADVFVKGANEKSCIPLRTLAAAFGINASDRDRASVRGLRDAYIRQKYFGGNPNWPKLIFYIDANGTSRPLDARTVRSFVSTELFSRAMQIVRVDGDRHNRCVVVDTPAITQVAGCLRSATETQPPSESCKTEAKTIDDLNKPQLAKLLGQIRVNKEEVTIPDDSLGQVIPRAEHSLNDKLGGDKSTPGCIVSFGVRIPDLTYQIYSELDLSGVGSNNQHHAYNCSPSPSDAVQIVTANYPDVKKNSCGGGQTLGWQLTGLILDTPNTQPLAFLLHLDTRAAGGTPFEVKVEISANPRPGAEAAKAAWKLSGRCR
jgi:hypothetical protein